MYLGLSHLRLVDLELFITAAHLKSLSKAAVIHHLSQSAASAAVQRVEAAFRRPLCTHEKRRFCLTSEGQDLVPKAEAWLKDFRDTLISDGPRPIRLVTTHAIARVIIPVLLPLDMLEVKLMRPDQAYEAMIQDEADLVFALDNALWSEVTTVEVGTGSFQLFTRKPTTRLKAPLLPENQIEVLTLLQRWTKMYSKPLEIKARIPSWSLIADICAHSEDVGFLPDFLGFHLGLKPVAWQPQPSSYRLLALYKKSGPVFEGRIQKLIEKSAEVLAQGNPTKP